MFKAVHVEYRELYGKTYGCQVKRNSFQIICITISSIYYMQIITLGNYWKETNMPKPRPPVAFPTIHAPRLFIQLPTSPIVPHPR